MTRVLDIDLDFFLSDPCPFAPEGERPSESAAEPWSEAEMCAFLEDHLHLNRARPIPGRVFPTHDGALFFWRDLIREGRLTPPFHVTHVDAHTDLGIGDRGHTFVRNSVLCRPVASRVDPEGYRAAGQLNEANYLVFALAFRWLSGLDNVRIPTSLPDFPSDLRAEDGHSLRLKSAFPALFEARYGDEPAVPFFETTNGRDYTAPAPFDFLSLAISPRYAPASADALVPVIMSYAQPT